jgi:hypothetical protein
MATASVAILALVSGPLAAAAPPAPLERAVQLGPRTIPFGQSLVLPLAPLPARPGKLVAIRLRIVAVAATEAGCNFNASVRLNDNPLGRYTSAGEERLLERPPATELAAGPQHQGFPVFSGPQWMVVYAPSAQRGDAMTTDGQGATFLLDVSDLARGVDGNSLSIRNTRPVPNADGRGDLLVETIEVGWVDKSHLAPPLSDVPARGPIAAAVESGGLRLAQADGGGFALRGPQGPELLVETALGMDRKSPSTLVAEDPPDPAHVPGGPRPRTENWGPRGFRLAALFGPIHLLRTLEIRGGVLHWNESWTNTADRTLGVPFRHRLFLRREPARFRLAGDADSAALASSAGNPTLFLESRSRPGAGFGLTAESDWLRLLVWLRTGGGVGEAYSESLALAPLSRIDLAWTVTPAARGGYWTFINAVRRRWGVNGYCMPRPLFWGYAHAAGNGTTEEILKRSLGHLGPIYLTVGPWQRGEPDCRVVREGRYPKLPSGAPRAPGACGDFDVESFLTWAHREPSWREYGQEAADLRRACPQVEVVAMMHPAMEAIYRPLAHRWPNAAELIRDAEGKGFEVSYYSQAWLYGYTGKDWTVFYYVPRPGSAYLAHILSNVERGLDRYPTGGVYCDEFSWASRRRDYSRYDYSRWDGYSADLDRQGRVLRLKCDNAWISESAQLQITHEVLRRGKFFLGNGPSALRSVNRLPIHRFVEGGNGHGTISDGQLSRVPLVLGNMGDEQHRSGVFESVKQCLSSGSLYSPTAVNLLLDGPENFVSKLYPITIRQIGPGWVEGEERLATTVSGDYPWPHRGGKVRLLRYDGRGALVDRDRVLEVPPGDPLKIEVLPHGLVIAEKP